MLLALATREARAQESNEVAAEALFQQGRDLLEKGELDTACPKLAESYRLDAATGTLMALAMCHERQGKLASAWAEYTDTAARANAEGREDRELVARERAQSLKARLSSLTVEVPAEVASISGLAIRRDGVVLGAATWGTPIPVDGGKHVVVAGAPGKRTFQIELSVAAESANERVRIPVLEATPAPAKPAPPPAEQSNRLLVPGLVVGGVGVAAWGVGGYFLAKALSEKADSDPGCDGNACNPNEYAMRQDMVRHGNVATGFAIAGTVLVGTGVTLIVVGWPSSSGRAVTTRPRVMLNPVNGGGTLSISGAL